MGSREPIPGKCGHKCQDGTYCSHKPAPDADRCLRHNGQAWKGRSSILAPQAPGAASLRSMGSTAFKSLAPDVAGRVAEAYNNPVLLSIRPDVALFEARRDILAERIETGESGATWKKLKEICEEIKSKNAASVAASRTEGGEAIVAKLNQEIMSLFYSIPAIVTAGNRAENAWDEMQAQTQQLVALKRQEHGRLKDMHEMCTSREVFSLIESLAGVVQANVEDPEACGRIADGFQKALSTLPMMSVMRSAKELEDEIAAAMGGPGGAVAVPQDSPLSAGKPVAAKGQTALGSGLVLDHKPELKGFKAKEKE